MPNEGKSVAVTLQDSPHSIEDVTQKPFPRVVWLLPLSWAVLWAISTAMSYITSLPTGVIVSFQILAVGILGIGVTLPVAEPLVSYAGTRNVNRRKVQGLGIVLATMVVLSGVILIHGLIVVVREAPKAYETVASLYNEQLNPYTPTGDASTVIRIPRDIGAQGESGYWNVTAVKVSMGYLADTCWMGKWSDAEPDSITVYPTTLSPQECSASDVLTAGYLPDAVLSRAYPQNH